MIKKYTFALRNRKIEKKIIFRQKKYNIQWLIICHQRKESVKKQRVV
jgi:hypothetical protein